MSTLPKPMFANVGRAYVAAAELGLDTGNLNRDRADTVLRALVKKPGWLALNRDVYQMWIAGADPWHCFIRDLGTYTKQVRAHMRAEKKAEADAQRDAERAEQAALKAAEREAKKNAKLGNA